MSLLFQGEEDRGFWCWWLLAVCIGFPRPGLIGCQANEHPGHIYGPPWAQETPGDRTLNPYCLTHMIAPCLFLSHLRKSERELSLVWRSTSCKESLVGSRSSRREPLVLFPGVPVRSPPWKLGKPSELSSPPPSPRRPSCLGSVADLWTSIRCLSHTCADHLLLLFFICYCLRFSCCSFPNIITISMATTMSIIFNVAFNQGHAHLVQSTMGFLPSQLVLCNTLCRSELDW